MVEIYKQASIVVPVTLPRRLPKSILLDPASEWHRSALLVAAIESVTLPSRLKDQANRDTLGSMADTLNAMGKQTVASLQMSFTPSAADDEPEVPRPSLDSDDPYERRRLDVDFSASDMGEADGRANGHHKQPKLFSELTVQRGYGKEDEMDVDQDERMPRRRNLSEPVRKRYAESVHTLAHLTDFSRLVITHRCASPCSTAIPKYLQTVMASP